jgi:thymidylate synthase (FAD)
VRVFVVAATQIVPRTLTQAGWQSSTEEKAYALQDGDVLAEFAGRLCYQSWSRPNPNTRTNAAYLAHILAQQHHSVLEHASISLYVDGVSRSFLAELTRHRHLSFSVLSQRFVDEWNVDTITPPALSDRPELRAELRTVADQASKAYVQLYNALTMAGLPRKQAREAARAVLPNATETKLIVTGNVRAWREVIEKRNTPHAEAEIRRFAARTLELMLDWMPHCFQDMAPPDPAPAGSNIMIAVARDTDAILAETREVT